MAPLAIHPVPSVTTTATSLSSPPSQLLTRRNTESASSLDTNASRTVRVKVTADLLCAWCYIGLKKLQMAHGDDIEVAITFRPFLIQPHIPAAGVPTGGTPETRVSDELREAAAKVGLTITGLCNRTPDSKLFHACVERLQQAAAEASSAEVKDDESLDDGSESDEAGRIAQSDVVQFYEAVLEGYHTNGIYPDQDGLMLAAMRCARKATIASILRGLFADDLALLELKDKVHEEAMSAIREGVLSVPHFKFNNRKTFSGAQPMETFALFEETYAV